MGAIRINQIGYTKGGSKRLAYLGKEKEFQVISVDKNQVIYAGRLSEPKLDSASADTIRAGNFSCVHEEGKYYIQIGNEVSYQFLISADIPKLCTDTLLKGLYYQRCGVELVEEFAGPWKHPICHTQPAYVYCQNAELLMRDNPQSLERIDTSGGWHDAGDYGRYTIAAAKTVLDMMFAYEHFRQAFDHPIGIPESKLAGADILHEIKVGLDFLLKMQKKTDGSVYTKVATRHFPGMIRPEEDTACLFVFDTSGPATASYAGVMAMAARIYKEFDSTYAYRCLKAAMKAYQWLKHNKVPKLFKNPPEVTSGEYGDASDLDERYMAAVQMYLITGEEAYHQDFINYFHILKEHVSLGWQSVSGYGSIVYLLTDRPVDKVIYENLKQEWLNYANLLELRSREDGYGITLALTDYHWGSTMVLLGQSVHLIVANRLLHKPIYDELIERNWDYIFGRNPMDLSYVTGLGTKQIMYPHHRLSAADNIKEPVPGLLSGGPNNSMLDEAVKEYCQGMPPAKCYVDHVESFSTNEIDTYWNSVAIYVGAYLCR